MHNGECNRHGDEREEHDVAELRASKGVGGDAARVVVDAGGNNPRTHDGQEQSEPDEPRALEVPGDDPEIHDATLPLAKRLGNPFLPRGG